MPYKRRWEHQNMPSPKKSQPGLVYAVLYIVVLLLVLLYQAARTKQHNISRLNAEFSTAMAQATEEFHASRYESVAVADMIIGQFGDYYYRALIYIDYGDYEQAVEDFSQAYQITEAQPALLVAFPNFLGDFHKALLNRSMIYLHQ